MTRRLAPLAVALALVPAAADAAAPGHLEGFLPAAARVEGRFGSVWTTDVWIYQQGASVVHLWFNPADRDNTAVESVVVELDEPVTMLADVVGGLFATEGVGSIHYLADGPLLVTSRTWTAANPTGSYGQTIAGVPIADAAVPGDGQAGALRMIVDQLDGFRTNLGVVNLSRVATTVAVEIFTADGAPAPGASSFTLELAPFGMTQVDGLLDRLAPGDRHGLIFRVGVTSAEGAITAYTSTVDNATNDASYQQGARFAY
ncbi:MAG: hypothetical protein MUC56_01970 [Thermoanaerobaculales bacterium]|jgi:hypothetical protein|nr:hypothetical protein [Thermoanaerobaculales bacterium]